MSLSKLNASVASVNNDVTAALASFKFDFTLIKVEPPQEYSPLRMALSRGRREDAETGKHHQTARKLGALFETLIPPTPALIKAYGKRVSEILEDREVNPEPVSGAAGIFAEYVGVDGTSIWAAATSGPSAIAVHLLACMIARMFTPSEATSIWHELVEQRKKQLVQAEQEGLAASMDSLASKFEITRVELGSWDASVRAWIQSADHTKSTQQSRLMSAIQNSKLPIENYETPLETVKTLWVKALQAMENLVSGIAQTAGNAAVLLGLSAWHIYPDLLILGSSTTKPIKQEDHLVATGGLLTLGLQMETRSDDSIFWSLPLAYLRYYGDPVVAHGSVGPDNSRITSTELVLVVLGCLFRTWRDYGKQPLEAATWFPRIVELLHEVSEKCDQSDSGLRKDIQSALSNASWLHILAQGSTTFLEADEDERQRYEKLINLGRRRATFLSMNVGSVPPLLGLSDPANAIALLIDPEMRIGCLRKVAADFKLQPADFVIKYLVEQEPSDKGAGDLWEYATIAPLIVKGSLKRSIDGDERGSMLYHARWTGSSRVDVRASGEEIFGISQNLPDNVDMKFGWGNHFCAAIYHLRQPINDKDGSMRGSRTSASHVFGTLRFSTDDLKAMLTRGRINVSRLLRFLAGKDEYHAITTNALDQIQDSLKFFASMVHLYKLLPGAMISTRILTTTLTSLDFPRLRETKTLPSRGRPGEGIYVPPSWRWRFRRAEAFACLAFCETGSCKLHSSDLNAVFALSSGNSIFVAGDLLCDPWESVAQTEIRRLAGNIGRAGLALLIPPQQPRIRKSRDDAWTIMDHKPFNGVLEDNFRETSLHLSFTGYTMPLSVQTHGDRDTNANLVESVVSIHDRGQWVADVDIAEWIVSPLMGMNEVIFPVPVDGCSSSAEPIPNLIAVDNWDELLEPPEDDFIIRAYKNWSARLALTAMCIRLSQPVTVLPSDICCLHCYYLQLKEVGGIGQMKPRAIIC